MHGSKYLATEFFVLFIALPLSLLLPYDFRIKGISILVAFVYLLFVMFRKTSVRFRLHKGIDWQAFGKTTVLKFLGIAVITTLYVYVMDASALFCVPRHTPGLWVTILFVYTFLSVWPQEVNYRTFFFERYEPLFTNTNLFIFVNAIVFCMAHLFLRNTLVTVLTFIGGLLFAYTYTKTKSTTLVSIEHAVYGNWLFTVGMGQMLAFPGMDSC